MTTAASVALRPLALRARRDLQTRPLLFGGRRVWGVKDPLSLRYYQLRDEEHFILELLNGSNSLRQIQAAFEEKYAPQRITLEQIQSFVALLHEHGLIIAEMPGQGEQLLLRRGRNRRRGVLAKLGNPLAIRFRGLDPTAILNCLSPKCRWMFSRWAIGLCVGLMLAAATLAAVEFDVLVSRLPGFRAFFSPGNLFWLAVALAVTKVVHELAHGLTCRHFGGECRELGFMLLAFTPCLYCNVSDAWMLPQKWKRIAISAAGMYAELLLASLCTFLWWFSQPGLLNALCLNVMFICSVSTILFNCNPLLRYDGYYVLSDLVEVPNLHRQATALIRQRLAQWFAGVELRDQRMLPDRLRGFIGLYGVASALYRWFVIAAILWFCYQVLKPHGLEVFARLLAVVTVVGLLAVPATRVAGFLRHPGRSREVKWGRLVVRCSLAAGGLAALFLVRWPYRIAAPAVLEPEDARRVYVSVPGTLLESIKEGATVEEGEELARLQNRDLMLEVSKLRSQRDELQLRLENLESRRFADEAVSAQIPAARERLADVEEQLRRRLTDQQELTLRAPVAGTVLRPFAVKKKPEAGQLPGWAGSPLDSRNVGSFLETGTLFCLVGNPERMEAALVVDQADIELVQVGQQVRIVWNHRPGSVARGTITEISKINLETPPRELLAHQDLPLTRDESGVPRLTGTSYQVRVRLDEHDRSAIAALQGRAKIDAAPQSLARRLYRYLSRTFSFEL